MLDSLPGLTEPIAAQYLGFRRAKRAPLTAAAWSVICAEVGKSGAPPDAALSEAMAAGWTGFKASWLANRNANTATAGGKNGSEKTIHDERHEFMDAITGRANGAVVNAREPIDIPPH